MQHVVFISSNEYSPWGGSELLWCLTAERLLSEGMRVTASIKAWKAEPGQVARLRELGCRVLKRNSDSIAIRTLRHLLPIRSKYADQLQQINKYSPDLVVISQGDFRDGLNWMRTCRQLKLPYVVIAHMSAEQFWPTDSEAANYAECYEGAIAAFFVSNSNLELCRRQFSTPLKHARVVRNPFGVSYDAAPTWPGDSGEHLSLACVGRLDLIAKGQDLLVDVLARPKWRDRSITISLYGDGSNKHCLEYLIKGAKLDSIKIAGHVRDVEHIWSLHHALILPSRFEGLPLAIVEAMLCGRACIATDVAGNGEVIIDGVNGYLAPAPTASLLDEAMERAWERRSNLQAMGQIAASDIRKIIPRDPIGLFAHELKTVLSP